MLENKIKLQKGTSSACEWCGGPLVCASTFIYGMVPYVLACVHAVLCFVQGMEEIPAFDPLCGDPWQEWQTENSFVNTHVAPLDKRPPKPAGSVHQGRCVHFIQHMDEPLRTFFAADGNKGLNKLAVALTLILFQSSFVNLSFQSRVSAVVSLFAGQGTVGCPWDYPPCQLATCVRGADT